MKTRAKKKTKKAKPAKRRAGGAVKKVVAKAKKTVAKAKKTAKKKTAKTAKKSRGLFDGARKKATELVHDAEAALSDARDRIAQAIK